MENSYLHEVLFLGYIEGNQHTKSESFVSLLYALPVHTGS